jgi:alkylhydroperoxidase family enzyme
MAPRITPLKRENAAPAVEALYKRMDAMGNPPPNMHLTFGKNPALYESWLPFAVHIIPSSSLAHRDRQLLILRTAFMWRSGYVWSQHVEMSKRVEALTDEEMSLLDAEEITGTWTPAETALLQACDDTRHHGEISDPVWSVLAETFDEQQLLDIVFTIGQYALISTSLNSLHVELDAGLTLPAWAES